MNTTKLYVVTTEGDCEGRSTRIVGYATGDPEDIKVFYDNMKEYQLYLGQVDLVHVSPSDVKQRRDLLTEKKDLEKRLKEIEAQIKT